MTDNLHALGPGDGATRSYLSDTHLSAAFLYAARAAELHPQNAVSYEIGVLECEAAACSSVLLSVAFLEAFINELLADALDHNITGNSFIRLPRQAYQQLIRFWESELALHPRVGILRKYRRTLEIVGRPFPEGEDTNRDAESLIALRNRLVHYSPKWILQRGEDRAGAEGHELTQILRDRFPGSAFAKADHPWYPGHCLGAGCALWAAQTALKFAREFIDRLGWPDPGLHLLGRLPSLKLVGIDPAQVELSRGYLAAPIMDWLSNGGTASRGGSLRDPSLRSDDNDASP